MLDLQINNNNEYIEFFTEQSNKATVQKPYRVVLNAAIVTVQNSTFKYSFVFDYYNSITVNSTLVTSASELYDTLLAESSESTPTIINPLPVSNSQFVHVSDIESYDTTGWTGDLNDLFNGAATGISNTSGDSIKTFEINFTLAIPSYAFAIVSGISQFSNLKVIGIFGEGNEMTLYDNSSDATQKAYDIISLPETLGFGGLRFEFHTTNPVEITTLVISKYQFGISVIRGLNPNGVFNNVNTNILGNLLVSLDEQKDAFGRLKTAEPYTEWDSSLPSELADTVFWSELINGGATSVYNKMTSSKTLSVASNGDYIIRSTKQRFKYQPFKSLEWVLTSVIETQTGTRKRVGYVDYDNVGLGGVTNVPQNGVFFENDEGILSWNIANNGIITETETQQNWNIDKCDGTGKTRFNLNVDSANIFTSQLEWLGVGVVLVGFAIGSGSIIYCHAFIHASEAGFNNVYMRTANLPISYEITSTGGNGELKAICSSVVSGGGFNPKGLPFSIFNPTEITISNNETQLLCGMRLKEDSFEYTVDPRNLSILSQSGANALWVLCINPTYSGTVSWTDVDNSELQEAFNNNNAVSNFGVIIQSGTLSNNTDSVASNIESAARIGKSLGGVLDELWLCVRSFGNDNYIGSINGTQLI